MTGEQREKIEQLQAALRASIIDCYSRGVHDTASIAQAMMEEHNEVCFAHWDQFAREGLQKRIRDASDKIGKHLPSQVQAPLFVLDEKGAEINISPMSSLPGDGPEDYTLRPTAELTLRQLRSHEKLLDTNAKRISRELKEVRRLIRRLSPLQGEDDPIGPTLWWLKQQESKLMAA